MCLNYTTVRFYAAIHENRRNLNSLKASSGQACNKDFLQVLVAVKPGNMTTWQKPKLFIIPAM